MNLFGLVEDVGHVELLCDFFAVFFSNYTQAYFLNSLKKDI